MEERFNLEKLNNSHNKKLWYEKDEKDFFNSFSDYLLLLVNNKHESSYNKSDLKNQNILNILNQTELTIENIRFDFFGYKFTELVKEFKSISFENCHFNVHQIEIKNDCSFNKCLFDTENDNRILNIFIPENVQCKYSDDCMFVRCTFKNEIEINPLNKDFDIAEYSEININLFFDCELKSIIATNIIFNAYFFKNKIRLFNDAFYCIISNNLFLKKCKFNKEFKLNNSDVKILNVDESIFNDKCKIVECEIQDANFKQTKFKELVGFDSSTFNKTNFRNTRFFKLVRFNKTKFLDDVNFDYSYFMEKSIFTNMVICKSINLEKAFFNYSGNFLHIKNEIDIEYKINVANRETARIIKDSFEQQNNIIEANKFYALEMKEREKELKFYKEPFEWLIFKIHGMVSNHSQDWLLALFWIINLTFVSNYLSFEFSCNESTLYKMDRLLFLFGSLIFIGYGIFRLKNFYKDILIIVSTILFYIIYSNSYIGDENLKEFSNMINPFSIMTGKDELTFGILIYKITIAYLIYQLIVSIRQNTRRK